MDLTLIGTRKICFVLKKSSAQLTALAVKATSSGITRPANRITECNGSEIT